MACVVCKKPYVASSDDSSFDSDGKPHVCNTCGKSFSLKIQLKRHILSHEGGVPYICNNCEKHLDHDDDKTYNLRLSKKGNFSCETCNKCFNTQRLLLRHASEHTLENFIHCEECGESFKNATSLKKHAVTHKSKKTKVYSQKEITEKSYGCNDCGESFAHIQLYEIHCLSHTKYKCESCNIDFPSNIVLEEHCASANCKSKAQNNSVDVNNMTITSVTPVNSDDKKHTCDICSKSFARKSALEGHIVSHLEERESAVEDDSDIDADFSCSYKGEKSNERWCLPKLKIRRSFSCEKCNKVYSSKNLFDKHLLSHQKPTVEDKKKYPCRICKEIFLSKEDYKMHKLSHHPNIGVKSNSGEREQKSYACSICNEVFQKKRHLRKHSRIHSEESSVQEINLGTFENKAGKSCKRSKNFACGICARRFAGERCLKKHEARHAEHEDFNDDDSSNKVKKSKKAKTLVCEICNQDYSGRSHAFIKHKLSHTPEVCGICDARFIDRAALREHCRVHIGTEEGRRFIECSQKALDAKNGVLPQEPKVEYIYLVLR